MSKVKFYSEIISGRLSLVSLENGTHPRSNRQIVFCSAFLGITEHFHGFPGYFGPPNLAQVFEFSGNLRSLLSKKKHSEKIIVLFVNKNSPEQLTNAAFLVGAFAILVLKMSIQDIIRTFQGIRQGLVPFRDTTNMDSASRLPLKYFLMALQRAISIPGIFSLDTWNVALYKHLQSPEGGDITWIVPGKFVAFPAPLGISKGPLNLKKYIKFFMENNITTVVRCGECTYDPKILQQNGIVHHEMYFEDCTSPSVQLMERFLKIAEKAGIVAVHCYAGLGRTGTLISAFLIKHTDFTALEAVAWLRILRPGSVIGRQQDFLQQHEQLLKKAGRQK